MYLQQFFVEGLGHASYLIGSDTTHEAALVDPNRTVRVYLDAAQAAGLEIRYVLETHVHNDFLSGARAIADQMDAEYVASADAGLMIPHRGVKEDDELRIGELLVRVLATPGHTPEHVSYVVIDTQRAEEPVLVFTGGDLLVGSVGRPDLLGRELGEQLAPKLFDSLFGKLLKLADYVEVLPTHGAGSLCGRSISSKRTTTIGYERRFNRFLQKTDKSQFVSFVLDGNPYVPAYYANMRPGNLAGADGYTAPPPRPLNVQEVEHALGHGASILDTRGPAAFGGGHIPGSYHVGFGPMLATWVGSLISSDEPLILVLQRDADWSTVVESLGRIGFEHVKGYLLGGIAAWQERGLPLDRVEQIDAAELSRRVEDGRTEVLDVRMDSEWEAGHIAGAHHVVLGDLPKALGTIDVSRPTAVVCGTGYRSSIATALLQRHGASAVSNVPGGMTAWNAADLPTMSGNTDSPEGGPRLASAVEAH